MTWYHCQACGLSLSSRGEAEYHYGDCAAFVEQTRDELTAAADDCHAQSSQDEETLTPSR
jgi:hypothetical protein